MNVVTNTFFVTRTKTRGSQKCLKQRWDSVECYGRVVTERCLRSRLGPM